MSFIGKLASATVGAVITPIEVAKDVCTGFGALTEQDEPYTVKRLKQVGRDISDLPREIEKDLD